ncbi:PA4575 family protein [Aquipseudomonas campi]
MSRSLCLTRQCLGLTTRIECLIRPLAGDRGLWTLLCAAGMSGAQPSAVKAQGPFYGPLQAETVLDAIADSLSTQGYLACAEPAIWSLHLHAELRRLNAERQHPPGDYQFRPES